jgi:hypothetical protein
MAEIKCAYMNRRGYNDYYCTKVEHTVPYDTYDRYCTSYSYDNCPNYKYEKPSSGCYITTVTCDILGLEDKNIYLQTFRKFRKDYLQKTPETLGILEEYDFVGPIIAQRIMNDENKQQLASELLKNYIHPIAKNLLFEFNGNYDYAIKSYAQMTKELIKKYNLEELSLTIPGESKYDFNKDYSSYGHGRKLKR